MSLIVVDAGNTNTKFGVFDAALPAAGELPLCRFAATTRPAGEIPADEFLPHIGETPSGIVAGSNPDGIESISTSWPADWCALRVIERRAELPIDIGVEFPETVGIDRLLAAVGANHLRETGQPAVVIDSGTATTVDFVNSDGVFCGGAILPGFELGARALHEHTARLPRVVFDRDMEPPSEIGRNTEAAITSGLYWGQVGAVKELMRRMMHVADHRHPLLLLTGGAAPLLHPHLPSIVRCELHLVLQGLALTALTGALPESETGK
jgi:type III pantothenate kinase